MQEHHLQEEIDLLLQEKKQLVSLRKDLLRAKDIMRDEVEAFKKQKDEFYARMHAFEEQSKADRRQLEEDQKIFDKKFKILEMGFKQLSADRAAFESQKRAFFFQQKEQESKQSGFYDFSAEDIKKETDKLTYFCGVTNQLALKKRYKDLIKIYHPDNLAGDKHALQQINREYEMLKKSFVAK